MAVVEAAGLTHRYAGRAALRDVHLSVPEGSIYALLGPNGAGKTTLLQILMGLRRPTAGRASVLGRDVRELRVEDKAKIGYVAEGQKLPGWMTLGELEAWLAPLYPTWDHALANELRSRFRLDASRKIRTFSRGETMKAALLCGVAFRPKLLLMDEPFTGMDVVVKDELVRGLLESAGREGWTVVVCSHDVGELEMLADWVGYLDRGRLVLSQPMDEVRERFHRVDVSSTEPLPRIDVPENWHCVDRSSQRISFVLRDADAVTPAMLQESFHVPHTDAPPVTLQGSPSGARIDALIATLQGSFPGARIDVRPATLREIFIALGQSADAQARTPELVP